MIPNNLKECRLACGLTQLQVADRLGLNCHDRLSKWEHGNMYPHMINLFKMAAIYNKTPVDLYPELWSNTQAELTAKPVYSDVSTSLSPQDDYQVPLKSQIPHESDVT